MVRGVVTEMARKVDEPMVTISRRCYLCGKHYVLGHPKDYKPFCDECLKKIAKMIGVRDG